MVGPAGRGTSLVLSNWHDDVAAGSARNNFFYVDDFESAVEDLQGRGIEFSRIDRGTPFGSFAVFADPDGNEWSLHDPYAVGEGMQAPPRPGA